MRYCGLGREGENISGGRERGMGLKRGQHLVDFDQCSKSTQSIFGHRK